MIKQRKPRELKSDFVVSDIENDMDPTCEGKLLHIGTTFRDVGAEVHVVHDNWGSYLDWLIENARVDKRFRTVWAHNGGGWDWNNLVDWLLENRSRWHYLRGTFGGNRNIFVAVVIDEELTIKFCDSYLLFRSSLNKLVTIFLKESKVELKELPGEVFKKNPTLYFEYLKQDCSGLLRVLESAMHLIHHRIAAIGGFGPTVGSTAMRVYTTGYLPREIRIPAYQEYMHVWKNQAPPNPATDLRQFLRDGYKGGRCEVFQHGHYDNVRVYDINSMYPWAMKHTKVPVSDRGVWTTIWTDKCPAIYEIRFKQSRKDIPPVLMVKQSGAYEGCGVFYNPEIAYLKKIDPKCTVEIVRGFIFQDCDYIFESFVDTHYKLRLDNPDTPIAMLGKQIMVNLYGKFCQRSEREEIVTFSTHKQRTDTLCKYQERELKMEKAGFTEEYIRQVVPTLTPRGDPNNLTCVERSFSPCPHEHVGIGGMITSASRVRLHEGFMAIKGLLLYCDTDSVHVQGTMEKGLCGKGLGLYKLEFPESVAAKHEGVYAGRKLYALRQKKSGGVWSDKIRMKGVRVGGKMGFKADFDTLVEIANGGVIIAEYQTTETMRSTWVKRSKPNRFKKRQRRIRRT
jgi:hypothetical protein